MKSVLALSAALMPVVMGAALPQDTVLETREKQIVGGTVAPVGEWPYIVSLSTEAEGHWCGGSLLNAYTVISAAHCTEDFPATDFKARAGSLKWASGGKQVAVKSFTVHPDYNSGAAYNNDIALWHLASPIKAGGNIAYVNLTTSGNDPTAGSTASVAGWGRLSEGGTIPDDLRRVDVPIVTRSKCNKELSGVTKEMVCAGFDKGGKDSCQGDSGGPLVDANENLIGVVSWGFGCARPNKAGVYTRVGEFVSWIQKNKFTS